MSAAFPAPATWKYQESILSSLFMKKNKQKKKTLVLQNIAFSNLNLELVVPEFQHLIYSPRCWIRVVLSAGFSLEACPQGHHTPICQLWTSIRHWLESVAPVSMVVYVAGTSQTLAGGFSDDSECCISGSAHQSVRPLSWAAQFTESLHRETSFHNMDIWNEEKETV